MAPLKKQHDISQIIIEMTMLQVAHWPTWVCLKMDEQGWQDLLFCIFSQVYQLRDLEIS